MFKRKRKERRRRKEEKRKKKRETSSFTVYGKKMRDETFLAPYTKVKSYTVH